MTDQPTFESLCDEARRLLPGAEEGYDCPGGRRHWFKAGGDNLSAHVGVRERPGAQLGLSLTLTTRFGQRLVRGPLPPSDLPRVCRIATDWVGLGGGE